MQASTRSSPNPAREPAPAREAASAAAVRRFLHAFWGVRQRVAKQVAPTLEARHALRLGDYFLLQYVAESALPAGEIATRLDLPAHHVSRHLDALERQGLLERSVDPRDARRRVLTPTPGGERRLREATATMERCVQAMLGALAPDEQDDLIRSLETLAKERPA